MFEYAFKIGDRVRALRDSISGNRNVTGMEGKIVDIKGSVNPYGIVFDENIDGHTLFGQAPNGCGWWLCEEDIELVREGE